MKKLLMIAVIALVAVACNKDQKVVKKLDGTWNCTSWMETYGGSSEEYIADGYTFKMGFNNCKLKDDEFCEVTITQTYDGESDIYAMEYRVAGGGTSLEIREKDYPSELTLFGIEEFEKDKMTLHLDYGDGDSATLIMEKE